MDTKEFYMEDVYEMKKYPYFGYMRGRYTLEELREIDDYGDSLGIEVIPNIQTLGHMEQYLRWSNTSEQVKAVRDTESVLLCGAEETYELLEEMISTMRRAFRSSRIHLNMDEALDVGFGRYLQKNGYRDRFAIMNGHLTVSYTHLDVYKRQTWGRPEISWWMISRSLSFVKSIRE